MNRAPSGNAAPNCAFLPLALAASFAVHRWLVCKCINWRGDVLGNVLVHRHRGCLGCPAEEGSIYREGFGDCELVIAWKRESQMI